MRKEFVVNRLYVINRLYPFNATLGIIECHLSSNLININLKVGFLRTKKM